MNKLLFDFGTSFPTNNGIISGYDKLISLSYEDIIGDITHGIAVTVENENASIYIYETFTDALNQIKELEYEPNSHVEVFEFNNNGYTTILNKPSGGEYSFIHSQYEKYDILLLIEYYECKVKIYKVEKEAQ